MPPLALPVPEVDLVCRIGDTFTLSLTIIGADTGNAQNESAFTFAGQVWAYPGGSSTAGNVELAVFVVDQTDASGGVVKFSLSSTTTAAFTFEQAYFDLRRSDTSSPPVVVTLLQGTLTTSAAVTQLA